jgi:hypothetical protein
LDQLRAITAQRKALQQQLDALAQQEVLLRAQQHTSPAKTLTPTAAPYVPAAPPTVPATSPLGQHLSQPHQGGGDRNAGQPAFQSMSEVLGRVVEIAQDQSGCRFLQKKFEDAEGDDAEVILREISMGNSAASLMTDPFGNYLIQKIFQVSSDEQLLRLLNVIAKDMPSISFSMHGTRSVQKVIECVRTPQHMEVLISALQPNVIALIKDLNGNHVIQKCLQKLADEHKQFIYDAVGARLVEVATNRQGCCVLQRCIDYAGPEQREQVFGYILSHALQLVQDPFANYVVQYIVDLGDPTLTSRVIRQLLHNIVLLSCNKFSSNVVEKCIKGCQEDIRQLLIDELTDAQYLPQLLQDGFANYVLQTAITVASPSQYQQISEAVRPLLHLVRNSPYGKKIENKLARRPKSDGKPFTPAPIIRVRTGSPSGPEVPLRNPNPMSVPNNKPRNNHNNGNTNNNNGGGRRQQAAAPQPPAPVQHYDAATPGWGIAQSGNGMEGGVQQSGGVVPPPMNPMMYPTMQMPMFQGMPPPGMSPYMYFPHGHGNF